jgi:polysaccharide export outer membrane protein
MSPLLLIAAGSAVLLSSFVAAGMPAQQPAYQENTAELPAYILGPEDQITIRALDAEEIDDKPVQVETNGYINVPLIGSLKVAGLTVQQVQAAVAGRLKTYIRSPKVTVSVAEFRSQPVSVMGAVNNPGVHQLKGNKRLVEILSLAGGLRPDAGAVLKIARRKECGPIPLPAAAEDATGQFSVAEISIKDILEATHPEENIPILPHDVITVPRAEMIYVIGEVNKSGGFVLNERKSLSVLEALSLAGGIGRAAAPHRAKILRPVNGAAGRTEVPVDLGKILEGRAQDVPLRVDDILFVPTNTPKNVALRAIETAVQTGSGVVIWRSARY